ncbi:hypothetical protein Q1695_004857 [Nippostrongylus brasiliensis]|nr:hypothetical protein Q1695_004857 [Nippostrongylus brasiliensis]
MLDTPLRIFRCYICLEHEEKAPLQELSMLIEHLAKHYDFHLFECRDCKLRFVTPFLANFHIKEGRCKREEGELADDGGPLLRCVDLDTVEFSAFCTLQNAITKCMELMLDELRYGEDDLIHCLNFNRATTMCPVSPEPIILKERQMQTSPPLVGAVPPSDPAPPVEKSPATRKAEELNKAMTPVQVVDLDAEDGFSLISDDEMEQEESNAPSANVGILADEGLSTVSNSLERVAEVPPEQVARIPSPVEPRIVEVLPAAVSIPSLMSVRLHEMTDHDHLPPRRDVRRPVVLPERPLGSFGPTGPPAPAEYAEADSSSSSVVPPPPTAPQAFFFQAMPRPQHPPPQPHVVDQRQGQARYDPVYPVPVFGPFYASGVRSNPPRPSRDHRPGQVSSSFEDTMSSLIRKQCNSYFGRTTAPEVSSSTSSGRMIPAFPDNTEPFEMAGQPLQPNLSREYLDVDMEVVQFRDNFDERMNCETMRSARKRSSRQITPEKPIYSYGIKVLHTYDPHADPTTPKNLRGRSTRTRGRRKSTTGASAQRSHHRHRSPSDPPARRESLPVAGIPDLPMSRSSSSDRMGSILAVDMPSTSRHQAHRETRPRSQIELVGGNSSGEDEILESEHSSDEAQPPKAKSPVLDVGILDIIEKTRARLSRPLGKGNGTSLFSEWKKKYSW